VNFDMKTDMKAARLFGYSYKLHCSSDTSNCTQVVSEGMYVSALYPNGERRRFTLADPATRDAVVQALGEKYDVAIIPYVMKRIVGWKARFGMDRLSKLCADYEDAIRMAVDEVIKDE